MSDENKDDTRDSDKSGEHNPTGTPGTSEDADTVSGGAPDDTDSDS